MTSNVEPPEDYNTWRMNVIKKDLNTNSNNFQIPLNNDGKNIYGIDPNLFPDGITEEKYKKLVQLHINRDNEKMTKIPKVESSNKAWVEKRRKLRVYNENKSLYDRGIKSGAPVDFLKEILKERGSSDEDINKIMKGGKRRKTKKRRKTIKKGGKKKRRKLSRKKTKKRRSSKR